MMPCVVSHPKREAVWGILCLGKSTCALWPYGWLLVGCNGGGSLGRPGRGRQTCSLRLHSGQKPELVKKKKTMRELQKHEHDAGISFWIRWLAETPAQSHIKLSDNKATRWVFTTSRVKCTLHILSRGKEIAREVKGRWVISRHSIIIHSGAVEVMTPLAVHPPMGCIHHMSDPQLPQTVAIIGHWPVDKGDRDYSKKCIKRKQSGVIL